MNTHSPSKLLTLLTPALAILFLVIVQAYHFHARPYRQDEAWVVHYALENIERVGLVNHILQIFVRLPPENILQDIWAHLFGHIENIVRWFSTLTTVITLAMFYRLAADLFGRQTARLALILLGTLSVFAYYTHEARPYAALAFGAVGFQWALLRFIRRPDFSRALLALLLALIPFYQHPFMLYVYAAQLVCVLVFVRWNRALYRRGAALFGALGALIALRAYLNFSERSGVILYETETSWRGLSELYDHFKFNPEALGLFLILVGLAVLLGKVASSGAFSADSLMRFGRVWREGWIVLSLLVMVGLALLVNLFTPSLTPRNLLIAAPCLALIAAIALSRMHWQAQLLALLFFCLPFVIQFRPHNGNAGYWELADYMEANYDPGSDRLVVVAPQVWQWIPIKYFLDERTALGLSDNDIFYATAQGQHPFLPHSLDESLTAFDSRGSHLQRLQAYLGERDKLWVIRANHDYEKTGEDLIEWIEDGYTLHQTIDFPGEGYYTALEVLEYRRHPEDAKAAARFGDDISLTSWRLNDSVEALPGQTISVDTWWTTDAPLDALYSSTLVIADSNGQGIHSADDAAGGIHLSTIWQPGQLYFDERHLTIPDDIEAGEYLLLLGLYDILQDDIRNLPVNPTGSPLLYLTTLYVRS